MDDRPRRRTRRPKKRARASFPLIPILLGVVVAGFAIGAILSLLGRGNNAATVASAPVSPLSAPTSAPVVAATEAAVTATPKKILPPHRPPATAAARATEAPKPTPEPSAKSSAAPSLAPTSEASAETTPAPKSSALSTRPPVPLATTLRVAATQPPLPVIARAIPTPAPRPVASVRPATAPATAAAGPAIDADSEFSRSAAAVVQAYLEALARGDDEAARASLAAPAGSAAAQLSEKAFAGPDMHIAKLEAHGSNGDARVDVDIDTPRGPYFAQFYLKRTGSGAVAIVNHNFIKP